MLTQIDRLSCIDAEFRDFLDVRDTYPRATEEQLWQMAEISVDAYDEAYDKARKRHSVERSKEVAKEKSKATLEKWVEANLSE